jgi:hypothetical protein
MAIRPNAQCEICCGCEIVDVQDVVIRIEVDGIVGGQRREVVGGHAVAGE